MKRMYLVAAGLFCLSCSKQKNTQPNTLQAINNVSDAPSTDLAANPLNPYDGYGALHNEGMNYVQAQMKAVGETKPEAVTKFVQQFSQLKTGQPNANDYYALYQRLMKDSAHFYSGLVEKANLSPAGRKYLQTLFSIITRRASMDKFVYNDIKAEIMAIETDLSKDATLSENDRKELLKAGSLARYSAYYWSTHPPAAKSIFRSILACVIGICSDLSALDPLCGSFLNWLSCGDFDPIAISSIMYYAV